MDARRHLLPLLTISVLVSAPRLAHADGLEAAANLFFGWLLLLIPAIVGLAAAAYARMPRLALICALVLAGTGWVAMMLFPPIGIVIILGGLLGLGAAMRGGSSRPVRSSDSLLGQPWRTGGRTRPSSRGRVHDSEQP
ncbi:MAG: hypothetical protein K0V04_12525 [Deltaproteobacteria bacterium]|nr:hypothetical protein [Deltaproteobacteria bacterium]